MAWALWLGAALLLALAEMLLLDLFLLMLAGGALVATVLALVDAPVWAQVVGFAVGSTLMIALLRPWMLRHLRQRVPLKETNAAALVGQPAVVVAQVSTAGGRVKLRGEVWSARTESGVIPVGSQVVVRRITGAIAVVASETPAPPSDAGTRPAPTNPTTGGL